MELWHLCNRGVDKRKVFLEEGDYVRFVHDLYEFNDTNTASNTERVLGDLSHIHGLRNRVLRERRRKERIVDIHGWCLMKNHYHLLVSERLEGGVTKFLRKLNIGYANYFNEKYQRSGALFQGRTKKVLMERDAQFSYILHYIHANPLDYLESAKDWRRGTIQNTKDAMQQLESYRWSSYLDYIGNENFPSLLTTTLFGDVFRDYKHTFGRFLRDCESKQHANIWLEYE